MFALDAVLSLTLTLMVPQAPADDSSGPLAGVPQTVSVEGTSLGGGTQMSVSEIYWKPAGFWSTPPLPWTPRPFAPDFRIKSIFAGATTPLPDLDAMSIGLDWIQADSLGRAVVPDGQWAALTFSVTRATKGGSGVIRAEVLNNDAPADLFSYVLPGSSMPPAWVDIVTRAQNSPEISIGTSGKPANIDAHDIFMTIYAMDPAFVAMLPAEPEFYFSVSSATTSRVPSSWWGGSTPSGATVLFTKWDFSKGVWSKPAPFLTYAALGLALGEDLDALAVDPIRKRIMFSTKTASRDPVLVGVPTPAGIAVYTYRLNDATQTPVSKRLGLLVGDDVDAICALDPGGQRVRMFLPAVIGAARTGTLIPGLPARATATAFRNSQPPGQNDLIDIFLIGWPRPGVPAPGQAAIGVTFPGTTLPLIPLAWFQRNPTSPFPGDPIRLRGQVPRGASLQGLPMLFHWILADSGGGAMDMPHPTLIHL